MKTKTRIIIEGYFPMADAIASLHTFQADPLFQSGRVTNAFVESVPALPERGQRVAKKDPDHTVWKKHAKTMQRFINGKESVLPTALRGSAIAYRSVGMSELFGQYDIFINGHSCPVAALYPIVNTSLAGFENTCVPGNEKWGYIIHKNNAVRPKQLPWQLTLEALYTELASTLKASSTDEDEEEDDWDNEDAEDADAESSGFDHAPWAQQVPILQTLLNKRASSEPRFAGATIAYKPGAEYRPGEYELSLKHEGRFRVVGIVYVKPLSEDTWQEVTIVPDDGEVDWGYHIYGTHTQPIDLEDAETALTKLLDKIVAGFSSTELRIPKDTCNQCQYFTGKKKHGFYRCHTGNCPALSLAFQIKKRKNT